MWVVIASSGKISTVIASSGESSIHERYTISISIASANNSTVFYILFNVVCRFTSEHCTIEQPAVSLADYSVKQESRNVEPRVGLMLDQRLRRWPNIKPTLAQRLVFAVKCTLAKVTLANEQGCIDDPCHIQEVSIFFFWTSMLQ